MQIYHTHALIHAQGLKADKLVPGFDMTFEAGMTKLCFLFGQGLAPAVVKTVSFVGCIPANHILISYY